MNELDIFSAALEILPPDDRARYLDEACAGNAALRKRIDELLRSHGNLGSFMDSPADALAAAIDAPPVAERPGQTIGPYRLLEQIGEGGMGAVYLAEQLQPVHRNVALKIIRPGMDTRQVIARFEAERQALALMDHPNIAKVLDAGTTGEGIRDWGSGIGEEGSGFGVQGSAPGRGAPAGVSGQRSPAGRTDDRASSPPPNP